MSRSRRSHRAAPPAFPAPPPAVGRPLYARLLGLRYLRPGGLICFLLLEGVVGLAVLLALAELVSWWGVLVLPAAVALMVKLNDVIAGATQYSVGPEEPDAVRLRRGTGGLPVAAASVPVQTSGPADPAVSLAAPAAEGADTALLPAIPAEHAVPAEHPVLPGPTAAGSGTSAADSGVSAGEPAAGPWTATTWADGDPPAEPAATDDHAHRRPVTRQWGERSDDAAPGGWWVRQSASRRYE